VVAVGELEYIRWRKGGRKEEKVERKKEEK